MAIRYRIDSTAGIVYTTATGSLSDKDLLEHKRALMGDSEFKPGMKELSDVRSVDQLDVTPQGVRTLAAVDKANEALLDGYRLAIVASADVVYGMARMYQTITGEEVQNVRIFRDIESANAWLGLKEDGGLQ